jgi:hypothetical protein
MQLRNRAPKEKIDAVAIVVTTWNKGKEKLN